jgi:formyl-CoA transferase
MEQQSPEPPPVAGPLAGVRVLELGQLIAAPFCGMLLGAFGAEVVKVEPPGRGDPMRSWRRLRDGTSLGWYSIARNKKSITLDLRKERGQALFRKLVGAGADVVIENFRPGRMEAWGLGFEALHALRPGLVMVRVSGFGQTGPYARRPGFAAIAEAMGGLRYLTGEPGRPPVRTGVSLGDTLAGLHGALGAVMALYHRDRGGTARGQVVDTAIYESVFNMMESLLPEYDADGFVRGPAGARLPGIVPSSTYPCSDGKLIVIGGNNDSIFKRLMYAIERPDLAEDPQLARNPGRVERADEIDAAIGAWTSRRDFSEVFAALEDAEVPVGPIYDISDIARDAQFLARGMFERVQLRDGASLQIPKVVPQLSETPSATRWIGPELGAHNDEIYTGLLGLDTSELDSLRRESII